MRIDSNQTAPSLSEGGRTGNPGAASVATRGPASVASGGDQAQLSGAHVQVRVLASQASELPEIREEKVNALRQVVYGGAYQPSSNQVAEAVFAHMLVTPAA